jgi:hypothetical protein
VNNEIRRRIAAYQSAGQIAQFLETREAGLGAKMLSSLAKTVAYRRVNPKTPMNNYPIDVETIQVPMDWSRSLRNRAAQTAPGAYAMHASDALTMGLTSRLTDDPELTRAALNAIGARYPWASATGRAAGTALQSELGGAAATVAGGGRIAPWVGDIGVGALAGLFSDDDQFANATAYGLGSGLAGSFIRAGFRPFGRAVVPLFRKGSETGLRNRVRAAGNIASDELQRLGKKGVRLGHLSYEDEVAHWLSQGLPLRTARYFAEEAERGGSHLLPRRFFKKLGISSKAQDGIFNVLRPRGISKGRLNQLHYGVDKHFKGAGISRDYGGGGWSGQQLGWEKFGPLDKVWFAIPGPTKAVLGSGLAAGAILDAFDVGPG